MGLHLFEPDPIQGSKWNGEPDVEKLQCRIPNSVRLIHSYQTILTRHSEDRSPNTDRFQVLPPVPPAYNLAISAVCLLSVRQEQNAVRQILDHFHRLSVGQQPKSNEGQTELDRGEESGTRPHQIMTVPYGPRTRLRNLPGRGVVNDSINIAGREFP